MKKTLCFILTLLILCNLVLMPAVSVSAADFDFKVYVGSEQCTLVTSGGSPCVLLPAGTTTITIEQVDSFPAIIVIDEDWAACIAEHPTSLEDVDGGIWEYATFSEGKFTFPIDKTVFAASDKDDYSYKIGLYDDNVVGIELYIGFSTGSNTAPTLKTSVAPSTTKYLAANATYTVDLTGLFEDADGDSLTYKVAVGNGEYSSVGFDGAVYSATYSGTETTLYFKANDGTDDSEGVYTVYLKTAGNKTALNAAIAQAEALNSSEYYTSGDRYNGKDTSTNGFWADMQSALTAAKNVAANASQDAVDTAAANLSTAIGKLIPKTQVNATALYENVNATAKWQNGRLVSGDNWGTPVSADNCTGSSWTPYAKALADGQALLENLFDRQGDPTGENTAAKQTEVDRLADAAAPSNLVNTAEYNTALQYYQSRKNEAEALLAQHDPTKLTASDYSLESWNAYTTAYNALKTIMDYRIVVGGLKADMDMLQAFIGNEWSDGGYVFRGDPIAKLQEARNGLTSTKDITVSFTYINNFAAKFPPIRSGGTDLYANDALELRVGSTTLGGAVTASGITFDSKDFVNNVPGFPAGDRNLSDTNPWFILFVNDVFYAADYQKNLLGNSIQLHDGDVVRLVRASAPAFREEVSSGYDSSVVQDFMATSAIYYQDSYATINMAAPGGQLKVGDKAAFAASVTGAYGTNLGQSFSPENISLFISEPQDTKTLDQPTVSTAAKTDASGKLEYVFTQPGWYTVAMFNNGNDEMTYKDIYGEVTYGQYRSLYAGDYAMVYVEAADNEAALVTQYRAEKLAEATGYFERFHDYDFAAGYYEATFLPCFESLKAHLTEANDLTTLMSQYDTDFALLQYYADAVVDHEAVIAELKTNLSYVPQDLSVMDETYKTLLTSIQTTYKSLSEYQKSMLTSNELARLDVVAEVDVNALKTLNSVTVMFTVPSASEFPFATEDKTLNGTGGSSLYGWPNLNWNAHQQPDGTIPEYDWKKTRHYSQQFSAYAGDYIYTRLYLSTTDAAYRPMWSSDDGASWAEAEKVILGKGDYLGTYYLCTYQIPEDAVQGATYSIKLKMVSKTEYEAYLAAQDAGTLAQTKEAAIASLQAAYDAYDLSKYDDAGKAALAKALSDGKAAVNAATTNNAVTAARQAATAAMASVRTSSAVGGTGSELQGVTYDSGNTVGKVRVTIENTTFSGGAFTGTIADGNYDLGENDTMMTMVLKVLQSKGYSWNGTTDSNKDLADYSITYLSSIAKDNKELAEFSGGQKSGWMGTLNDWFVNEGFNTFSYTNGKLENGDVIRIMYTCEYGADIGGTWQSSNAADTRLKNLVISSGTLTPAFDSDVKEYSLIISDGRTNVTVTAEAANKNYQVRTFLNQYNTDSAYYKRTETISITSGNTLYVGIGESNWPSMNVGGKPTQYVIHVYTLADAIAALPSASVVNSSNYKTYQSTASAMRSLIRSQNYTGNVSKLTALEEKVAFYSEIDNVKSLLAAIPDASKLTTSDKSKVQAAKAAYDKLTDEQKQYITVGDVAKYNAAVEWLEKQGVSTGGQITGSDKAPEDVVKPAEGTTVEVTPEATVTGGEAKAEVSSSQISSALTEAKKDENTTAIVIAPEVKGDADKVTVEIPKSAVSNVANSSDLAVTVSSDVADVTIQNEGLTALAKETGSTVTVSAEKTDDGAVKVEVAVGNKVIDEVVGGLNIAVPVEKDDSGNVLVIVDAEGNETVIKKSAVDEETAKAIVDGSCTVKIVDNSKDFADVKDNAWYAGDVEFASSHELFQGVSETRFAPEAQMTRAMLATVLFRLEDAAATGTNAFADIPAGTWYTDAVTWANGAGIVQGYGNSFGSNDNILRQDLATMLYRYAKTIGMDTAVRGDMSSFNDTGKVSDYADDAMRWGVGMGIIGGKGNGVLDPKGNATRAEVAAMLQRLVKIMVK